MITDALKRFLREKEVAADRELQRALEERHNALRCAFFEGLGAGVVAVECETEGERYDELLMLWRTSKTAAAIDRELGIVS
jgi:hypothetical protein